MGFSSALHNVVSMKCSKIRTEIARDERYYVRDIEVVMSVSHFNDTMVTHKITMFAQDRDALKIVQGGERV
jgi:hypothetical protein